MPQFAHAVVAKHHGVPTLVVDGTPLHGMTATSCAFDDPAVIRDFVAGGCELMMIWIEAGVKCWRGPNRYDWSYAERKLQLFEEHAGDTKWIIRVRLALLDPWFARAHPTEVHNPPGPDGQVDGDMSVSVIHSPVWLANVSELIHDFVHWLKGTRWAPRIIGFMLNAGGAESWLPCDADDLFRGVYHPVIVRELRNWLLQTYAGEVEKLRAAWGNPAVTFETAFPFDTMMRAEGHVFGLYSLRDPARERAAVDYYRFLNETMAEALIAVCRTAKSAAGTLIICGGYHAFLWWESGVYSYIQEYGHGLVQRLNRSPWVDFVSDSTSYDGRYPGGPSGYLGLPHSLNLHGKLHYTEVDLATNAALTPAERAAWSGAGPALKAGLRPGSSEPIIPDRLWQWDYSYCGRDDDEQVAILQREHAHNLVTGTPYRWFDIRCHHYQAPALVRAMKRLSEIGKQAVAWDRRSLSQVAFVCSEDTPMYQGAMNGTLLRFYLESVHGLLLDGCTKRWGLGGVPFDIYELHDLGHPDFPGDQYRLIIFVNCAMIPAAAQAGIRRWQRDGRVLCWTYAAGVLDETHFDPALGENLIGMRLGCRRQRQNIHVLMQGEQHPLTRGGRALDFGTEGSVGPVFFADDPAAKILGTLRDGGEPACAVREHDGWTSVYLAMLNFGPALLRNLARFAGAQVWVTSDDTVYANRSLVCLHTATAGAKTITLPASAVVTDLWTGARGAAPTSAITVTMPAYRTGLWRTEYQD